MKNINALRGYSCTLFLGIPTDSRHLPTSRDPVTNKPSWAKSTEPGINTFDGAQSLRGRSISPNHVEDIIKNNTPISQPNGNLRYEGGGVDVILSPNGERVITIITK